jgi:hypothetical protein
MVFVFKFCIKIKIVVKSNYIIINIFKIQIKMPTKKDNKQEEQLKEEILSKEDKRKYYSEKFKRIEEQVKQNLKLQKTDDALRDMTI